MLARERARAEFQDWEKKEEEVEDYCSDWAALDIRSSASLIALTLCNAVAYLGLIIAKKEGFSV
jgi:hypothetical protein